jgi:thiamine-phosphate pyrophosphorylase
MTRRQILRILDANFNRSREGLRVCEEITRFVLGDAGLTRDLKHTRHDVTRAFKALSVSELFASRDTAADIGKKPSSLENKRADTREIFLANAQRAKESLRVLEEMSKLVSVHASVILKRTRFRLYAIEKRTLPKLETVRHHRPQRF